MFGNFRFNRDKFVVSTLRKVLHDKLNVLNSYRVPVIKSGYARIELKHLMSYDDQRLAAAMFVLRLVSNQKPYISKLSSFRTFREHDFDVVLSVDVRAEGIKFLLSSLVDEIIPFISEPDFSKKKLEIGDLSFIIFTLKDLSFIRVIETHSIFFRWRDKMRVGFSFSPMIIPYTEFLLNLFNLDKVKK